MALLPSNSRATLLLGASLVLVIVGTSLVFNATYDDDFKKAMALLGAPLNYESLRYGTAYFYFIWISSFCSASFQKPILMAITAGLLAAILVFSFSLDTLDSIRILSNILKDADEATPAGFPNPYGDMRKAIQKLSAGCIIAYVGAGLAFIASVIVFRRPSRLQGRRLLLAACILLFGFMGCIMLWCSKDVAYLNNPAGTRGILFDITEGTVAVLVVFMVGISCEIVSLTYVAAFLSAFYNLSSLGSYLSIKDLNLQEKNLDTAGIVFCWLSAVFMTFFCAFEEHSEYNDLGQDSHA